MLNLVAMNRRILKATVLGLILFCSTQQVRAQSDETWALGLSGIYDFQTNGIGIGARAYFPLTERLAVSPQVAYFPSFNTIHELYAGLSAQYTLLFFPNWHVYALGAGYYNLWMNYSDYIGKVAKPNNFAGEAGVGIMKTYGCLKPFAEVRYDAKWVEIHLQLGILISFGDCFFKAPDLCPAY
jgi:hypothetical protein